MSASIPSALEGSGVSRPAPSDASLPSGHARRRRRQQQQQQGGSRGGSRQPSATAPPPNPPRRAASADTRTDAMRMEQQLQQEAQRRQQQQLQQQQQQQLESSRAAQSASPHEAAIAAGMKEAFADWLSKLLPGAAAVQAPPTQQMNASASPRSATSTRPSASPKQQQQQPRASSRPVLVDGVSSGDGASSGNETDLEEEVLVDGQVAHAEGQRPYATADSSALHATSESNDSLSVSEDTDGDMLVTHSSSAAVLRHASPRPLVPCEFHSLGCESLVRSPSDPHYLASVEHHLSLSQARISILSSQKQQLIQERQELIQLQRGYMADREQRDARKQKKIERRDQQITHLRAKLARAKESLRLAHALQPHNIQDMLAAYLNGGVPTNAQALLTAQQREIQSLRTQLAAKDNMLQNVATHMHAVPVQQQQQTGGEAAVEGENEAEAEAEVGEEDESSSVPVFTDVAALSASFPGSAALLASAPPHSPPFKGAVPDFKFAAQTRSQPRSMPTQARPRPNVHDSQRPIRGPVEQVYHTYTVPHSSLKALAPLMHKASFAGVLNALSPSLQPPAPRQQRSFAPPPQRLVRQKQSPQPDMNAFMASLINGDAGAAFAFEQPGAPVSRPPPTSRGAAIGLDKFCPMRKTDAH